MSSVVDKGGSSYKMLKGSMVGFIKGFRIRSFMSMLHKHSLVIIPFFNLWISLHFSTFTSWKSSQFHLSLPCSKTIHEHAPSLVEKGGSSYKKLIGSMVEFMEGNMYQQEYYFVRERRNFSDVPSLCYCVHCSKKKNCECLWQTSFLVLLFPTLHWSICIMGFSFWEAMLLWSMPLDGFNILQMWWFDECGHRCIWVDWCPGVLICSYVWDLTKIQIQGSTSQMLGIFTRLTHCTSLWRVYSRAGP